LNSPGPEITRSTLTRDAVQQIVQQIHFNVIPSANRMPPSDAKGLYSSPSRRDLLRKSVPAEMTGSIPAHHECPDEDFKSFVSSAAIHTRWLSSHDQATWGMVVGAIFLESITMASCGLTATSAQASNSNRPS